MNIESILEKKLVIYDIVTGSHAYGTNTASSDEDTRGIFMYHRNDRLSLEPLPLEASDDSQDIKYYELAKFLSLLKDCNPNIVEMIYSPSNCIRYTHPIMDMIINNRSLFITKKAYHTHSGYAYAQIKKCKGVNKWINNPQPKDPPNKEDFCWVIYRNDNSSTPYRPIKLSDTNINLAEYHIAGQEHISNTYRLYYYGAGAKGVFRNGNLVCESIPLDEENSRCMGLLIYNEGEYNKAKLDWSNYWTWVKERNPHRWVLQESHQIDYDFKNMQHCVRLLLSCENIFKNGEPIVRFSGESLNFLRDIREGKYPYDEIMKYVDDKMVHLESLYNNSSLPWGVDNSKVNKLYLDMIEKWDNK